MIEEPHYPEEMTSGRQTTERVVVLLICLLYAALRLYHLGFLAMWHDEVFSAVTARMPWRGMFQAVIADVVHPPFFYILLKLWMAVGGQSVLWMRLLPYLFSVCTIPPLLALLRQLRLSGQANMTALLLITFNVPLIRYSQELRTYSLVVLLSVTSLWLFIRFVDSGEKAIWPLFLVNLLLIYSHYYGLLFVASEGMVALLWLWRAPAPERNTQVRRLLLSLVLLGIAFAPWAYTVLRSALGAMRELHSHIDWIEVPTFSDVTWYYARLNGTLPLRHTTILGLLLFLFPVALAVRGPRREKVVGLSVFAFFPTAVSVLASHLLPLSIFHPRYLIACSIPYLLMIVVAIFSIPFHRNVLAVVLVAWSMVAGLSYVQRPDRKIAWDALASKIHGYGARVYTAEKHEGLPLSYYGIENTILKNHSDLLNLEDPSFVFVYRETSWQGEKPRAILEKRGYTVLQSASERNLSETIIADYVRKIDH